MMENNSTTKKKNPFSQIPNALINDDFLKPAIRFVYVFLYSKPNDWNFYRGNLSKSLGINVETLDRYLAILEERGWIKKNQKKGQNGTFSGMEIELFDHITDTVKYPNGTDGVKNRIGKNREREIPQHSNTDFTNTNLNTNTDLTSDFEKSQTEIETLEAEEIPNEEIFTLDGEERKKKVAPKKKEMDLFGEVKIWPAFEDFWDAYKKKVGTEKCKPKWEKLKQSEKEKIMEVVDEYVASTPDKNFRKDPLTYLNGKHWNDEIIHKKRTGVQQAQTKDGFTDLLNYVMS